MCQGDGVQGVPARRRPILPEPPTRLLRNPGILNPVTSLSDQRPAMTGTLNLDALRAEDPSGLLDGIDEAIVFDIPMTTRFRGLTRRDGVLLHGPDGWGEVAPFWDYDSDESAPWLAAGLEAATGRGPGGQMLPDHLRARRPSGLAREVIPVNVTIPQVTPKEAQVLVRRSGATTAKVKVAGISGARGEVQLEEDLARLEAVRAALGPQGRIRIDVNGAWDLADALALLPQMHEAAQGLEYVEQPCGTLEDMVALRASVNVPIAADESIRRSTDPLAVVRHGGADLAVLKVAPLGGVRRTLALADKLGVPAVISSAVDTSVGLYRGALAAALLPTLEHACGLGTVGLLKRDVGVPAIAPRAGHLTLRGLHVSRTLLAPAAADEELTERWMSRMRHLVGALAARRAREAADPSTAIAGLPL